MQARPDPAAERILDVALELAARSSWERLRLHELAAAAGLSLEDLRQHIREKEDLTDLLFDRADRAMLLDAADTACVGLATRVRLQRAIMSWLEGLAPHRRVVRQMILGKLEPGHLHIQVPAAMRVSRTVQWLREAAGLSDALPLRAASEAALTTIYLAVFACWLGDESPGAARTRRLLESLLAGAEWLALRLPGAPGRGAHA